MTQRCGIDLGTTYSAISWYDAASKRVTTIDLDHADGNQVIPSVVYYEPGGQVVVGDAARNASLQHPERVLIGIKRSMGDNYKTGEIDGRQHTPQEVSAEILKVLKADAELYLGEQISEVVITVPAYFGDREREATRQAGEMAGFKVLETLPEPHAAALAFAIDNMQDVEKRNLLVYDLGGGTFDITLIRTDREQLPSGATGLKIETITKDGNRQLGGLDWDRVLARMVADKAIDQYGIEDPHIDAREEAALMKACETAKRDLSRRASTTVFADSQGDQVEISVSEFERETADLIMATETLVRHVLEEAEQWRDPDDAEQKQGLFSEKRVQEMVAQGTPRDQLENRKIRLLLCGGSTRMPMVRDCVTRLMGEPPLFHKNPDLLVTVGAAYRAYLIDSSILEGPSGEAIVAVNMTDTVKPIGVDVVLVDAQGDVTSHENAVIIKAGAKNKQKFEREFATAFDGMVSIPLVFYEGDAPALEECKRLADVTIKGLPPNRPAGRPVKVQLWYDDNGIVTGEAVDVETGQKAQIQIKRF